MITALLSLAVVVTLVAFSILVTDGVVTLAALVGIVSDLFRKRP